MVTIKVFCLTGLTPPPPPSYVYPIAPDERTRTGTGTEWQSSFTTSYTHGERYGGHPLVDRGRYTAREAPSDRGGTHLCEER